MDENIKRNQFKTVIYKPPPPPYLSKETLIIWEGWSKMGDREVARESAAKGSHVDLALTFLSQRKALSHTETQSWFHEEITGWAMELLVNKQVFRASHILKNVKLDPLVEIRKIFEGSNNEELREFLGNHLDRNNVLDDSLKQAWTLIKYIEKDQEVLANLQQSSDKINIDFINNQDLECKQIIAAELFLKTLSYSLQPLFTSKHLWNTCLAMDATDFLQKWFHVQFADENDWLDIDNEMHELLSSLSINDTMIDDLRDNESVAEPLKTFVYNTLAYYGIFATFERTNIQAIIARLINITQLQNIEIILRKSHANVTLLQFYQLLHKYCVNNELFSIVNYFIDDLKADDADAPLDLMKSCRELSRNWHDTKTVSNNLLITLNYTNDDNLISSLTILLILLLNGCDGLYKLLSDNELPLNYNAQSILDNLPIFNIVYEKLSQNPKESQLTMYDLLRNHSTININKLFRYRFDADYYLPNFKLDKLVNRYGVNKCVDFTFYLQQCRPSKACALTANNYEARAYKIACKYFDKPEITASCIAFLEMQGFDTEILRIEIFGGNLLLRDNILNEKSIVELLTSKDKEGFMHLLESEVCENFNVEMSESATMKLIDEFNLLITYAKHYNLKLPDLLVRKFAECDQWLWFLIVVQKFNYPQEQIVKLTHYFKSDALYEHLSHCLQYDLQYEEKNSLMRDRDSRKYFLSRIGVRKNLDDVMTSSVTSGSSLASTNSSGGLSDVFDAEQLDARTDLLQILIKCHNSNDPPKALLQACNYYKFPLFAVLATSYEPDSFITCWLAWLSVSCNVEDIGNYESVALIGSNVTEFLTALLRKGFYKTLAQSFFIFLKDNPLRTFMNFLCDLIELKLDNNTLTKHLDDFHKCLKFKRSNSFVTDVDFDMIYLNNKMWIESTSLSLLSAAFQDNFKATYIKIQIMEVFQRIDLQKYFLSMLPNFTNLLSILNIIVESKIDDKMSYFNLFNANSYKNEIELFTTQLLDEGLYEYALKVTLVEPLSADEILSQKWLNLYNTSSTADEEFWLDLDNEFKCFNITPSKAVQFFNMCNSDDLLIRYQILRLNFLWSWKNKLSNVEVIERDLWKVILQLNIDVVNNDTCLQSDLCLYSNINQELNEIRVEAEKISADEETKLEAIVNNLLDKENVYQALRLEKFFAYVNENLKVLKLCYSLAEGIILPCQLSAQERVLLRKNVNSRSYSRRKPFLATNRLSSSASRTSLPSSVGSVVEMETNIQDTLALLELLVENLKHGHDVGQNILMNFRISVNIDKNYRAILENQQPLNLLMDALNSDCNNKLEVVSDFIIVYNWTKQQITDFLCEQVINTINNGVESNAESFKLWDINLNTDIHLILQLLSDSCTMLGTKLYQYASTTYKAQSTFNEKTDLIQIAIVIELLIRAHDCYTADCNMEGISVILKKCQTIFNLLLTLKNWKLVVRLLTGIGRYNELNYVFHMLRENDQFEFLLTKGKSNKDNGLKVALLDYLKKYCPDNKELYRMVALYFTLYSEVAQLWESESEANIRNLIEISKLEMQNRKINPDSVIFIQFSNTDGTRLCLKKVMENYSHAAEYHLQGEKLAKAMRAAQQAELLALQISLLKGAANNDVAICVLNLAPSQISSALLMELNFQQALIVVEAYNYQPDWAAILYNNFILKNNRKYFDSYLSTFDVTDSLAYDISRHFLSENNHQEFSIHNMKTILSILHSVHSKYRIASELGFTDVVEDLLIGDKLVYLKDTVWKKGFKN